MHNILIAGCGRLGLRYLEGIIKIQQPLNIHIYDISENAIFRAKKFISTNKNLLHKFYYHDKTIDQNIDFTLIIVSSTADTRKKILYYLNQKVTYKYCILEKVLSQSVENSIDLTFLNDKDNVWVNTPRRTMPLYKRIKSLIDLGPIEMTVIGHKWGICCNGCHYIDLITWLTNETILKVNKIELNNKYVWYETKRPNFYDIIGNVNLEFSSGSKLSLVSDLSYSKKHTVQINTKTNIIDIDELSGKVMYNKNYKFTDKILLQSLMSTELVKDIINYGKCNLTLLSEHLVSHNIFIDFLIDKYNKDHNTKNIFIPIT